MFLSAFEIIRINRIDHRGSLSISMYNLLNEDTASRIARYRRRPESGMTRVMMTTTTIIPADEVFTRCHSINARSTLIRVFTSSKQWGLLNRPRASGV